MCSHLGRPKTPEDHARFAIAPVAAHLQELLPDDRLRVLENTRFNPGETANDAGYAAELAEGMDLYVNDAFGSAHRAHARRKASPGCFPRTPASCSSPRSSTSAGSSERSSVPS